VAITVGDTDRFQIGIRPIRGWLKPLNAFLMMRKADQVHPESLDDSGQKEYRLADTEWPELCEATAGESKRPRNTRLHPTANTLPVAPNLLEQNFTADSLDQKWVSDITYIWAEEGWLYLAVALELYSRRVIGQSPNA